MAAKDQHKTVSAINPIHLNEESSLLYQLVVRIMARIFKKPGVRKCVVIYVNDIPTSKPEHRGEHWSRGFAMRAQRVLEARIAG